MCLALLVVLLAAPAAFAQTPTRYADVRVSGERLAAAGVGIDHAEAGKAAEGTPQIRTVLSAHDLGAARAAGPTVDVLTVAGGMAEWDTARVAPGVYLVRLRSAAGEASRRVVVR